MYISMYAYIFISRVALASHCSLYVYLCVYIYIYILTEYKCRIILCLQMIPGTYINVFSDERRFVLSYRSFLLLWRRPPFTSGLAPCVFGSLAAAVNVSASTVWKHELTTAAQVRKTSHSLQSDSGGDVGVCWTRNNKLNQTLSDREKKPPRVVTMTVCYEPTDDAAELPRCPRWCRCGLRGGVVQIKRGWWRHVRRFIQKDLASQVFGRAAELLSGSKCETSDDQLGGKLGETTQQGTEILKVMFF